MTCIEPGCLAVVVNSRAGNDGKCVTVGRFIGEVPEYRGTHRWEVDTPMQTRCGTEIVYHQEEHRLLRIDGIPCMEHAHEEVAP